MLNSRDMLVLNTLVKVSVATVFQITVLCGYRGDVTVARRKIKSLIEAGYITSEWFEQKIIYTLTQKGLQAVGKRYETYRTSGMKLQHEEYKTNGIKLQHDLITTSAACLIYQNTDCSIYDIVFRHEMEVHPAFKNSAHIPDIVYVNNNCIEIELDSKKLYTEESVSEPDDDIHDRILANSRKYNNQVWVVPGYKPSKTSRKKKQFASHLENLIEAYGLSDRTNIITTDELLNEVKAFNFKDNSPRLQPVKGLPATLSNTQLQGGK